MLSGKQGGLTPPPSTVQFVDLPSAPPSTCFLQFFKAAASDAAHTSNKSIRSCTLCFTCSVGVIVDVLLAYNFLHTQLQQQAPYNGNTASYTVWHSPLQSESTQSVLHLFSSTLWCPHRLLFPAPRVTCETSLILASRCIHLFVKFGAFVLQIDRDQGLFVFGFRPQ